MAKYQKIYENGETKSILTFRGLEFVFEYGQYVNGMRYGKQKALEYQVNQKFKNDDDIEEICECVERIGWDTDEDIEEALEELNSYE